MIRSWNDKRAKAVFQGQQPKGLPVQIFQVAQRKLAMLNAAASLQEAEPRNRTTSALRRDGVADPGKPRE